MVFPDFTQIAALAENGKAYLEMKTERDEEMLSTMKAILATQKVIHLCLLDILKREKPISFQQSQLSSQGIMGV